MKKRVTALLLCLVMPFSLFLATGCWGGNRRPDHFVMAIFQGGYGREWADELARRFEAETGNLVEVRADAGIIARMETELVHGGGADLYFSHGIPWESFAVRNLLLPLDDLYNSTVENNVTFRDRVIESAIPYSRFNNRYYKVPWTQGVGGIAFNVGMFRANGWAIPQTYDQLITLTNTIRDAQIPAPGSRDGFVRPFVWPGLNQYLWDYVVYEWWAQLEGTSRVRELMSFSHGADTFNPNTHWSGMRDAFGAWHNLIAATPANSISDSNGMTAFSAQAAFINGHAAMMPSAHWLYNEVRERAPIGFEMAIMSTPTLANARPGYEQVNYLVGFGDSAVIPRNALNPDIAKDFLRFMAREDNVLLFKELTRGAHLAFNYPVISDDDQYNTFTQSVNEKLRDSRNFHVYSSHHMAVFLHETLMVWPENDYFYVLAFNDPAIFTPQAVFHGIHQNVLNNWHIWEMAAQ